MITRTVGSIGTVSVASILDSYLLGENMQTWFPDFDREAVRPHEHWLCPTHYDAESGHFAMPVHSWLLRTGTHNVLIDTCMGNDKQRPAVSEMHLLDTGYLRRLTAAGVHPDEIDYVLCTHLHCDHVGWNTRLENGRWVPTFKNAAYVISRTEYEAAKTEAAHPATPQFIRNTFADSVHPVIESGSAVFADGVHELLGCLTMRPAPGHSPGHVRIELRSQGDIGVFAGDIIHSAVQVPLWQWSSRVCWNPAMATSARRDLLEFCVAENALLLPGHFEAPHVGRVRHAEDSFMLDFGW